MNETTDDDDNITPATVVIHENTQQHDHKQVKIMIMAMVMIMGMTLMIVIIINQHENINMLCVILMSFQYHIASEIPPGP